MDVVAAGLLTSHPLPSRPIPPMSTNAACGTGSCEGPRRSVKLVRTLQPLMPRTMPFVRRAATLLLELKKTIDQQQALTSPDRNDKGRVIAKFFKSDRWSYIAGDVDAELTKYADGRGFLCVVGDR